MFGSAKERLAAFESKANGDKDVTKTVQGPRKIGKLNIPGQVQSEEQPAPTRKIVKKKTTNGKSSAKKMEHKTNENGQGKSEVIKSIKDSDLDLSVELEANISTESYDVTTTSSVLADTSVEESKIKQQPPEEKMEAKLDVDMTQKSLTDVQAVEATVAGVPKEEQQEILKPSSLGDVKSEEVKVAGIPSKDITTEVNEVKPKGLKEPEIETMTVAGIKPPGPTPDLTPKAMAEPQAIVTTVACVPSESSTQELKPTGISKPEAVVTTVAGKTPESSKVKEIKPEAIKQPKENIMHVAGIHPPGAEVTQVRPEGIKPPKENIMQVAGIGPEVAKSTTKPAIAEPEKPKGLKDVKGLTTTVAGIAPPGTASTQQKEIQKNVAVAQQKVASTAGQETSMTNVQKSSVANPIGDNPNVRRRPLQPPLQKKEFEPITDEFFDSLFYFSGMGKVVGSAMNQGVYVPMRNTSTALDQTFMENQEKARQEEIARSVRVVRRARDEAEELAEEIRKLQSLLAGLPTFSTGVTQPQAKIPVSNPPPPPPKPQSRRIDISGIDLIAKKVEAVAKDLPELPVTAQPIKSAFKPVVPVSAPLPTVSRVPPITTQTIHTPSYPTINAGAFKGVNGIPTSAGHWQDRYGGRQVVDVQAPKPFQGGGEISSGLKPWELSRLRGMEAKGYQFSHDAPGSGADYSDDFYHGGSHMRGRSAPLSSGGYVAKAPAAPKHDGADGDDVSSLAPFLVSNKSMKVDRTHLLADESGAGSEPVRHSIPLGISISSPLSFTASPMQQFSSPQYLASPVGSLPYCDL